MTTTQAPFTAPPATGLRERKKSEQRRNLQQVAVRLADVHGYKQLTVEAIAAGADVSTRTFFNYFSSKEEAVLSPGPDAVRELVAGLIARPVEESALTAARVVLHDSAVNMGGNLESWQARMRIVEANPHLLGRLSSSFFLIERALAVAIGRRLGTDPRRDPYTVLVASCAGSALRIALMQWWLDPDRPLTERLDDLLDRLASGLTQPPVSTLVRADPDASTDDLLVDVDERTFRPKDPR